jgi:hypothetical protein
MWIALRCLFVVDLKTNDEDQSFDPGGIAGDRRSIEQPENGFVRE